MLPGDLTEKVVNSTGPNANPRAKAVFTSLIRHLHAFAREVDLTTDEWRTACDAIVSAGKISSEKRNEAILLSDILGIETLVELLDQDRLAASETKDIGDATVSAVLGPFYRLGAPEYSNGSNIVLTPKKGDNTAHVYGTIQDTKGQPVHGAIIDVWHTGSHGLYDSQDPNSPEFNWRGRFKSGSQGEYSCLCLRPTAYPIPFDSVTGELLKLLDRTAMRPAHIHFYVQAPGYRPLITQIYDSGGSMEDAVFGVKDSLIVTFDKTPSGKAQWELKYDIVLAPEPNKAAVNGSY